ncbi:MAG: baseplate J/gp47 family protein [Lachnospiraceae bacterium]|nr:baseplate J/gp47 family protein [Lachnospiraceae bacterium]
MLGSIDLNNKSYEQLREEAVERIPIYSADWTNYNVSDPGITILENFSAFMALQQSEINEVPDKIKWRLLDIAGMKARKGSAAKAFVLLEDAGKCAETETERFSSNSRKLYAQDICYELEQSADGGTRIKDMRISAVRVDGLAEDSALQILDRRGAKGGLPLLGEKPSDGREVYFYLKDIPDAGHKTAIYFEIAQQFRRHWISGAYRNPFAEFRWEIKTLAGYVPIAVEDNTYCFLQSGYVVFSLDREICKSIAKSRQENAYVIKVTAVRADYDMTPLVTRVSGLLVEAVQKDTRSDVMVLEQQTDRDGNVTEETKSDICVRNENLKTGHFEIYGKESDGRYHRYYDINAPDAAFWHHGDSQRVFRTEYTADGAVKLLPATGSLQKVLAVCRDETLTAYRSLGILYGYDGQIVHLPKLEQERVYPQDFSVLVVEEKDTGDKVCHVVKPESHIAGEVWYSVNESDNTLTIHDCGSYEGAELRLGSYAVYRGSGGNIRAGTELICGQISCVSCTEALDGRYEESLEQVKSRFASDVEAVSTMVTADDCEQIMKTIPGLSIHKTGVYAVPEKNEIHIVVKPNSSLAFPKLSVIYRNEMERYLEKYRMLTTRIVIEQPVYVSVNVTAKVCFKKHFGSCSQKTELVLRELLDGIHSDVPFGSRIVFQELYSCLEAMDCVEEVCELTVFPDNHRHNRITGLDILLSANALYYCGSVRVESVSSTE